MSDTPMTIRSSTDLIALAPHLLGFHPTDSVLLMTFGEPGQAFHARVDLPTQTEQQHEVADLLLASVLRNRAQVAAVLIFSTDEQVSRSQAELLVDKLAATDVHLMDVLRVEDDRYFEALGHDEHGTAYDVSGHRFAAQMVYEGNVVQPSRQALAETLVGTDTARVAAIAEDADRCVSAGPRPIEEACPWVLDLTQRGTTEPVALPSDSDLARLLVDLRDDVVRDVLWLSCTQAAAEAHVTLWRHVVRLAPRDLLAEPAALLGLCAWLAGDGALAWCALDRCFEIEPEHHLAQFVAEMLDNAVPPSSWESMQQAG